MAPTDGSAALQGALDMLVLQALTISPMHGYAIAQHIGRTSEEVLRVEHGSLYPALDRLQRKGWVTSAWRLTPTGRRARYYTIAKSGRKRLGQKVSDYSRVALAIAKVLKGT